MFKFNKKIKFDKGQTYICEQSYSRNWIEGKEYKTEYDEISGEYVIYDEFDYIYFDFDINDSRLVFKLKEEKQMLEFKEGQTYICTSTDKDWWTEGREYKVFKNDTNGELVIEDDTGTIFIDVNVDLFTKNKFKLKEETDLIDNQPHYKNQGIEPIDLMRENFSKE